MKIKNIALVFALVASLLTGTVAIAAVKAGAACSKAGSTSVVSGKKFTCIKSGKKLVWDKGVTTKKSEATSKETPIPEPTSSPKPSQSKEIPKLPSEGDKCEYLGNTIKLNSGNLICRYVKNMELQFILEKGYFLPISNKISPDKLDTCRIKDLRTNPINQESIAFPVKQHALVNSGVLNWAIVPIDFTDAPGIGNPSDIYKAELAKIDEWMAWYSNGKLKVNWILKDEWIRAPLESQNYNWVHPGTIGTATYDPYQLMNELAKIGEKNFNYQNLDAVHYLYPLSVTKIYDALTTYGSITTSKISNKGIMNTANGYWLTNPNNHQLIWAWMIHEIGHPMGLTGHFPINPYQFGVMQNQGGEGLGLHSWDSLILNWINDDQVYCIDKENIKGEEITLVPVEREQSGVRSTMVRISENKVLVIESHRPDKWSFNMQLYHSGVMAFLVDTTKNTDRRDENLTWNATLEKTAWNLTPDDLNSRKLGIQSASTTLFLGDSITTSGFKVTVVKTGDNDVIKLEKVG